MTLEPLTEEHLEPLLNIATASPEHYRHTSTPTTPEEAGRYFSRAFRERDEGKTYVFALLAGNELVGTSRYHTLDYANRKCEIGFTWLSLPAQGTGINTESKYLMLRYAFETLDFLRVQFQTDARNIQSQRAIKRLGAVYEGTLRAERIVQGGRIRDTMLFSIIHTEWPEVKRGLETQLSAHFKAV